MTVAPNWHGFDEHKIALDLFKNSNSKLTPEQENLIMEFGGPHYWSKGPFLVTTEFEHEEPMLIAMKDSKSDSMVYDRGGTNWFGGPYKRIDGFLNGKYDAFIKEIVEALPYQNSKGRYSTIKVQLHDLFGNMVFGGPHDAGYMDVQYLGNSTYGLKIEGHLIIGKDGIKYATESECMYLQDLGKYVPEGFDQQRLISFYKNIKDLVSSMKGPMMSNIVTAMKNTVYKLTSRYDTPEEQCRQVNIMLDTLERKIHEAPHEFFESMRWAA